MPRSLDCDCQRALVPGAGAELAARLDLASLGDVTAQARGVLVVDLADLVDAEAADFAPSAKAATTTTAARSSSTGARAAASPWAAPATGAVVATGSIAAKRTVSLRAGSESGARRFPIGTAPTGAIEPLSWSVVAHVVLMFLFLPADIRCCRVILCNRDGERVSS